MLLRGDAVIVFARFFVRLRSGVLQLLLIGVYKLPLPMILSNIS